MVQSSGRLKMYATGWVTLCRNVSRIEASRWVTFDQNSNFFRIAKRVPGLFRVTLLQNHWVTLDQNMHQDRRSMPGLRLRAIWRRVVAETWEQWRGRLWYSILPGPRIDESTSLSLLHH